jgi:hypothetical protein
MTLSATGPSWSGCRLAEKPSADIRVAPRCAGVVLERWRAAVGLPEANDTRRLQTTSLPPICHDPRRKSGFRKRTEGESVCTRFLSHVV